MEIKTEILINAIPEKIWAILTDFDQYPSWNLFITYVRGTVKTGFLSIFYCGRFLS